MTRPGYVHPDAEGVDTWEEPQEACLRRELDLRPIGYPLNGDPDVHYDQRPCPTWCGIGNDGPHEVSRHEWITATHTPAVMPSIAATFYRGVKERSGNGWVVFTPTIDFQLAQEGQREPWIQLGLNAATREDNGWTHTPLVKLSVDDARETIAVLMYLIDTVEKG